MKGAQTPVPRSNASAAKGVSVIRMLEENADNLSQGVVQSIVASYAAAHRISEANARTTLIILGLGTATRLESDNAKAMRNKQAVQSALEGVSKAVGGGMRAASHTTSGLGSELRALFMQQVVDGLK